MRLRLTCEERENANDNSAMLLSFYKKEKLTLIAACTGCRACERVCPQNCIDFSAVPAVIQKTTVCAAATVWKFAPKAPFKRRKPDDPRRKKTLFNPISFAGRTPICPYRHTKNRARTAAAAAGADEHPATEEDWRRFFIRTGYILANRTEK